MAITARLGAQAHGTRCATPLSNSALQISSQLTYPRVVVARYKRRREVGPVGRSASPDYIRSTVRMPSKPRPHLITRAVRSHSSNRLSRNAGVGALSTGQFWKKPLYVLARSHRYDV